MSTRAEQLQRFAEITKRNATEQTQRLLDSENDARAFVRLTINEALADVSTPSEATEVRRRLEPQIDAYARGINGDRAPDALTEIVAATLEVVRNERTLGGN